MITRNYEIWKSTEIPDLLESRTGSTTLDWDIVYLYTTAYHFIVLKLLGVIDIRYDEDMSHS